MSNPLRRLRLYLLAFHFAYIFYRIYSFLSRNMLAYRVSRFPCPGPIAHTIWLVPTDKCGATKSNWISIHLHFIHLIKINEQNANIMVDLLRLAGGNGTGEWSSAGVHFRDSGGVFRETATTTSISFKAKATLTMERMECWECCNRSAAVTVNISTVFCLISSFI